LHTEKLNVTGTIEKNGKATLDIASAGFNTTTSANLGSGSESKKESLAEAIKNPKWASVKH
jgi:hypothetical protein